MPRLSAANHAGNAFFSFLCDNFAAGRWRGDSVTAQQPLEQAIEDTHAAVTQARTALRVAATALDRLNKRAYRLLVAEARTNPALKAALGQIHTEPSGPETLGIKKVLQGGADLRHILVSYDNGSFLPGAVSTLEWKVEGVDADFAQHHVTADPSGNALGPFTVGQTVKLRTRVVQNGTTTGSVRTLQIIAPT